MPNVFNAMPFGRLWGSLFFLFMTFAATSTVIAVFENLIVCFFELLHKDRQKIICWGMPIIILLSLPCVLGFNVWSGFQPFGPGTGVLDLEDFLVSNNLLPLGSLVYLLFCVSRYGWGWDNFIKEANTGKGAAFPTWLRFYLNWGLPLIVLAIFVNGYYALFFSK
jgi:NSS family neurotransmitter:Na+ symporter